MNKEQLLRMWLKAHGEHYPLAADQRDEFRVRSELKQILSFPDESIRRCVTQKRMLADVLNCLKESVADDTASRVDPANSLKQRSARSSVKPSASRTGRSRQSGSVWQAPVNPDEAKQAIVDFDRQDRHYP